MDRNLLKSYFQFAKVLSTDSIRDIEFSNNIGETFHGSFSYSLLYSAHDEEEEINSIFYDIPGIGGLNIVLRIKNSDNEFVPLAAGSLGLKNELPFIGMLQLVTAFEDKSISDKGDKENSNFYQIPHPLLYLQEGNRKIEWRQLLLREAERIVKNNGFNQLSVKSGFENSDTKDQHLLDTALAMYDAVLDKSKEWIPIDEKGEKIEATERDLLSDVLQECLDKKIITITEIKSLYPQLRFPAYWMKKIS